MLASSVVPGMAWFVFAQPNFKQVNEHQVGRDFSAQSESLPGESLRQGTGSWQ